MARYSMTFTSVAATAFADTTNLTNNAYAGLIQGGSSTQKLKVAEVKISGHAAASTVSIMKLARDSTVGATVVAGDTRNALTDASGTAPANVPVVGNSATTAPQRSATLHLLDCTLQLFGGIFRWLARHGEELTTVGNTASLGEVSLSPYTGSASGTCSGHIMYEVE